MADKFGYGGTSINPADIDPDNQPKPMPPGLPTPSELPQPSQMGELERMMMQLYGVNPDTRMQTNPLYTLPSQFAPKPVLGEQVLLRESDYDPATKQWMKAQPGSVPPGMGEQYNLGQSIKQRK